MEITATAFRQHLFDSLERAIDGEPLTVVYKGVPLTVSAAPKFNKLSLLKPQECIVGDDEIEATSRQLLTEMEQLWEEDWNDL